MRTLEKLIKEIESSIELEWFVDNAKEAEDISSEEHELLLNHIKNYNVTLVPKFN